MTRLLFTSCIIITLFGCADFKQQQQLQQQQQQTTLLVENISLLKNQLTAQDQQLALLKTELVEIKTGISVIDDNTSKNLQETKQLRNTLPEKQSPAPKSQKSVQAKAQPIYSVGNKLIVGEEEWVYFPVVKEHFKTRVDSGATTSSISAKNIEQFERDGKKWVRFALEHKDETSSVTLERPVIRRVGIKQSSSDDKESRAVISLMVKMGNISEHTEFTLADRSQMSFPVLLGRSFLRDLALVDVSQSFLQPKFVPEHEAPTTKIKADKGSKKKGNTSKHANKDTK